jgi:pumilio family protein 6
MGKDSKHQKGHHKDGKKVHKSLAEALKAGKGEKSRIDGGGSKKMGGKGGKPSYQKSWAKFASKDAKDKKKDGVPSSEAVHNETDKNKKRELKHQRAAMKPNFALVEELKTSWNVVRNRSTPESKRKDLVDKMYKQMTGHVLQVTLRHDASRMTQCILQYGTEEQRKNVLAELTAKTVEIAKTPYGHFTILKAISYCTGASEQKKLCRSLKGHFVALGTNVIGARTCESLLVIYPSKLTRSLRAEFYGKFTILVDEPPRNLKGLLGDEKCNGKQGPILDHMQGLVQKFIDKGLLEFRYVHELIYEYCLALVDAVSAPVASRRANEASCGGDSAGDKKSCEKRLLDLATSLGDALPKLIATKNGARTACMLATFGGAKERKRMMKVSMNI